MGTTPVYALPYPEAVEPADVPLDMRELAERVELALPLQPSVRVYHNAGQPISNGVETVLAFNSERWDTAAGAASTMHDPATNNSRLTCRYAGKYHVTANIEFAANATGQRQVYLRINGTPGQYAGFVSTPGSGFSVGLIVSGVLDLAVNDYVQVFVYQNSGGSLTVSGSSATNFYGCDFMMHRVA
jgi:hypothetical protein